MCSREELSVYDSIPEGAHACWIHCLVFRAGLLCAFTTTGGRCGALTALECDFLMHHISSKTTWTLQLKVNQVRFFFFLFFCFGCTCSSLVNNSLLWHTIYSKQAATGTTFNREKKQNTQAFVLRVVCCSNGSVVVDVSFISCYHTAGIDWCMEKPTCTQIWPLTRVTRPLFTRSRSLYENYSNPNLKKFEFPCSHMTDKIHFVPHLGKEIK